MTKTRARALTADEVACAFTVDNMACGLERGHDGPHEWWTWMCRRHWSWLCQNGSGKCQNEQREAS